MANKEGNKMDMKKNEFRTELLERAIATLPMDQWTDAAKMELAKRTKEEPYKLALELIDYLKELAEL